ncbi:hypothetical protein BHE90_014282, partial [Fusarium euwallaceae]
SIFGNVQRKPQPQFQQPQQQQPRGFMTGPASGMNFLGATTPWPEINNSFSNSFSNSNSSFMTPDDLHYMNRYIDDGEGEI